MTRAQAHKRFASSENDPQSKKKHTTQRQRFSSSMLSITTRRCEWNFHWKAITACVALRFHKTQAANASIIASTRKRKKIWSLPRLYLCLRSARFHDEISALVLAFILASCLRCWWKPGLSQISTRQRSEDLYRVYYTRRLACLYGKYRKDTVWYAVVKI